MKTDIKKWIIFFNCYAFSLAIIVLITTYKSMAVGFGEHELHWIMKPFYNDHTAYGAITAFFAFIYLGMIFLPNIKGWQRLLYIGFATIFLVGLLFSYSRAAWISFVAAAAFVRIETRIKLPWSRYRIGLGVYYLPMIFSNVLESQDSSGIYRNTLLPSQHFNRCSNVERLIAG